MQSTGAIPGVCSGSSVVPQPLEVATPGDTAVGGGRRRSCASSDVRIAQSEWQLPRGVTDCSGSKALINARSLTPSLVSLGSPGQLPAPVRAPPHIKKLDDAFGQFLVRVVCDCGACREIEPEALARLVGWKVTLKELAPRMRCSKCGKKAAEVVAVARPRRRGVMKNPHLTAREYIRRSRGVWHISALLPRARRVLNVLCQDNIIQPVVIVHRRINIEKPDNSNRAGCHE
jgi:hypothetical protein